MSDRFQDRHIGPSASERRRMLDTIGVASLDALIAQAVPEAIRLDRPLDLPDALTEHDYLTMLRRIAARNQAWRSFIGMGYYGCVTPAVIQRNMLENPGWYTPYTPYQSEIAQGRLEALLAFQTLVHDLTGTDISNASLLDEATAAAEAMTMLHRIQQGGAERGGRHTLLVSPRLFPQTLAVVQGRAEPLGLTVRIADPASMTFDDTVFGVLLQYPDEGGAVEDLTPLIARAHAAGARVAVATDLLALTLLTPPGEMGADVVVGSAQRLGVPLGYGGPHAAFIATREAHVRQMPGRLIGVSVDAGGQPAFRMALQTREQHIRREKATSNICTAQALPANLAAMFAVYHGPTGLTRIARRIHGLAGALEQALACLDVTQLNAAYFDTLKVRMPGGAAHVRQLREAATEAQVNLRYFDVGDIDDGHVGIAFDETASEADVALVTGVFARAVGRAAPTVPRVTIVTADAGAPFPAPLARRTPFLTHPVFNTYHSEAQMMRYLRNLERKDIGLDRSMIPLGSCTMKLNPAAAMLPLSWPEFSALHPFARADQARGYAEVLADLERMLATITGFAAVSLQPNSGAQGEFTGLMVIRAYHRDRGEGRRDVVLIPASAHGTNPASAAAAGLRVVIVASTPRGDVDLDDLAKKAEGHDGRLAALMITYPSTHGVFEDRILDICRVVHAHGGQVYMDGANMNAQVGLTHPAAIGADVCHLNLHKTFAIPHGGGGPGMGPIAVAAHLAPYLPGHPLVPAGGEKAIPAVSAAPWGSASILVISHAYIRMLGPGGLRAATEHAILAANYVKARLEPHFDVLYARPNGRVAHEMIVDLRGFRTDAVEITAEDVSKRLMDYGFHAPTVSFPVTGTLMIEPTESEPLAELDRFCDALIAIRREVQAALDGRAHADDNVLKNAPHTAAQVTAEVWTHAYTRAEAAFPLPWVRAHKFWPPVARIDNPYGDRNLLCICS